jgi:hypothetical protein
MRDTLLVAFLVVPRTRGALHDTRGTISDQQLPTYQGALLQPGAPT